MRCQPDSYVVQQQQQCLIPLPGDGRECGVAHRGRALLAGCFATGFPGLLLFCSQPLILLARLLVQAAFTLHTDAHLPHPAPVDYPSATHQVCLTWAMRCTV